MRVGQIAERRVAATEFAHRDPHLVDRANDVGLGALANGHLRRRDDGTFELPGQFGAERSNLGSDLGGETLALLGLLLLTNAG